MNEKFFRTIGWALPIVCMAIGAYATFSQYTRLQNAKEAQQAAEIDLKRSEDALTLARKQVEEAGRYAAVPTTDFEGTLFLNDLRVRAQKAGTQIQSWRTSTGPAADEGVANDEQKKKLLEGITRVTSELTLFGSYPAGRAFIEDLTRTSRLYTINNVRWGRSEEGSTELTVTVSRYLLPPTDSTTTSPEATKSL